MSGYVQLFTGITAISVLFMVVSMILITNNRTVGRRIRLLFLACLGSVALIAIADWFNIVFGQGQPSLRLFHAVSMAITFALAPVFPVIIAHTLFPQTGIKSIVVLLALHAILEFATIFGGYVFFIDASNAYHRGPAYMAYIVVYSVSAIYLAYQSIQAGRTYQSASQLSICAILGFLAAGVGIQLVETTIRTTWPTVGMTLFLYFQFYSEMILRTDALTHLLNRHSYDEFLARPKLPCTVVLIDVDNFKHVNDTYGHAFGDVCLETLARLIRRAFGSAGLCFRTGGDEFTVMVTRRKADIASHAQKLESLVTEAQYNEPRLPTVSVGTALAKSASSLPSAIEAADQAMYDAKRAAKQSRAAKIERL